MPGAYFRFPTLTETPSEAAGATTVRRRSAELERLLAYARRTDDVTDWRADCVRRLSGGASTVPPIAPILCSAWPEDRRPAPGASLYLATPVHARASLTSIRLPLDGMLELTAQEADELTLAFNRWFTGRAVRLQQESLARLFCVFDSSVCAETTDPEAALGRDVRDFLPRGAGASRLTALASEIEMWLFDHPINRDRAADGRPPVTSLWLWGGGPMIESVPACPLECIGEDLLFSTWARLSTAPATLNRLVASSAVPGSLEFESIERTHLRAAARALRRGELSAIDLSAGERRFELTRLPRWPWSRSIRPWWEYFVDLE